MKEILKLMELFTTYCGTKLNPHNFIREVLDNKYIAEIMKIIVNIDHKGKDCSLSLIMFNNQKNLHCLLQSLIN